MVPAEDPGLGETIDTADETLGDPATPPGAERQESDLAPIEVPGGQKAIIEEGAPRLALIIDDWGYGWRAAESFLELPAPLTVAVIPYLPLSELHARRATEAGFEVLLHLPMEPSGDHWETVQGMITTDMDEAEIEAEVEAALRSLPGVVGVNNHMGSKASTDPRVMRVVLTTLRQADLMFVDSRTSADSQGYRIAAELGLATVANTMFVDGKDDVSYIKSHLLRAAGLAKRRGFAVAIGHVRPATAKALLTTLPEIEKMGVQLVRVSELFETVTVEGEERSPKETEMPEEKRRISLDGDEFYTDRASVREE
jgi:polysaccharide deacetylase 2 family uncharacterized protein YibQ